MAKIVKGQNLKISADEILQEKVLPMSKEKKYFVITDEEGNIRGYFSIKEKTLGKD